MISRQVSSWRFSFCWRWSSRWAARRRINQTRSGTSAARMARTEADIWIVDWGLAIDACVLFLWAIGVWGWSDQRQLDGGAEVEEEGDEFVDRAGLEFGQAFIIDRPRCLFHVALEGEHHRLEDNAQGANDENDGGNPAVFAQDT